MLYYVESLVDNWGKLIEFDELEKLGYEDYIEFFKSLEINECKILDIEDIRENYQRITRVK